LSSFCSSLLDKYRASDLFHRGLSKCWDQRRWMQNHGNRTRCKSSSLSAHIDLYSTANLSCSNPNQSLIPTFRKHSFNAPKKEFSRLSYRVASKLVPKMSLLNINRHFN
jgi:hypothetical protein